MPLLSLSICGAADFTTPFPVSFIVVTPSLRELTSNPLPFARQSIAAVEVPGFVALEVSETIEFLERINFFDVRELSSGETVLGFVSRSLFPFLSLWFRNRKSGVEEFLMFGFNFDGIDGFWLAFGLFSFSLNLCGWVFGGGIETTLCVFPSLAFRDSVPGGWIFILCLFSLSPGG